jgi:predicted dehydrogenase
MIMPDSPIRIGIVGAGAIVRQRHLPGLRVLDGVRVVAVANSTAASGEKFVSEERVDAQVAGNWQELVNAADVDAVWIGAHPNLHAPVTVAALRAGKHVFCQARMARDLPEAQRMLAEAGASPDLVTMLCPPPHGLRQDAFIRRLIADSVVGDIEHVHLESLNGAFLNPHAPAHWRQRREISGRNVMTLGIYTEVMQRWLGKVVQVEATGRVATPERHGYRVTIPEELEVRATFAQGFPAKWSFSNIHGGPPSDALTLCGSGGALRIDFLTGEIRLEKDSRISLLETPDTLIREWRVERDFIDSVRNPDGPRPHPTFVDGVAYMEVVHAVEDARLSGGPVRLRG